METDTSGHFGDMLKERNLKEEWVQLALNKPDSIENIMMMGQHIISNKSKSLKTDDSVW